MPWGEVVHAADGALRGESPDVDFEGRMELTQGKGCRSLLGIMGEQQRDTDVADTERSGVSTRHRSQFAWNVWDGEERNLTAAARLCTDTEQTEKAPCFGGMKQSGNHAPRFSRVTAWVGLGTKQDGLPSRASRLSIKICVDRYGHVLLLFKYTKTADTITASPPMTANTSVVSGGSAMDAVAECSADDVA